MPAPTKLDAQTPARVVRMYIDPVRESGELRRANEILTTASAFQHKWSPTADSK